MENNKIIFGGYFGDTSIYDNKTPKIGGRGQSACKYIEIFYLWYLNIRKYLPDDYHIFLTDNASPINIDWMLKLIHEPIDLLNEDDMELDFEKKIHIKRFNNILPHSQGWNRMFIDWMQICYLNNLDLFFISTDALIVYNIDEDIKDIELLTNKDRGIIEQDIIYINKKILANKFFNFANVFEYAEWLKKQDHNTIHCGATEGGMTKIARELCNSQKVKQMSRPDLFIHDVGPKELKDFLTKYPIDHSIYNDYLNIL
jgi:hypothetical protein